MPVAGRKQKPPGQAINRNATLEWREVPDVPFTGGPKLPSKQPDGSPWPRSVRERWVEWSSMPHCTLWKKPDWRFAFDSLLIAMKFEQSLDPRLAAELRNREKVMATTYDYRRDVRIRYVDAGKVEPALVASLDDYRSL